VEGNRRIAFRITSTGRIECAGEFALDADSQGTKATLSAAMTLQGRWRLLEALFAGEIKKETAGEMRMLKRVLQAVPVHEARAAAT
jgi:hypothetical protein